MYLESAEISSRLLGDDHPTVADTLTSLGKLLMEQGRYEEARPHVERAVAINQQQREPSHIFRIAAEINLGTLRRELGDFDGAEALYRGALERFEEILGSDDPGTARVVSLLAQTMHLKGDLDQAESLYRRALDSQRTMPTRRLNVTESLLGLGSLLCLRGDTDEAESLLREALDIRSELLPEGHWRIAEAEMEWSQLLLRQNRPTEAARLLARAERVLSNSLVSSDRRVTRARELMARIPVSTSVG